MFIAVLQPGDAVSGQQDCVAKLLLGSRAGHLLSRRRVCEADDDRGDPGQAISAATAAGAVPHLAAA